VESARPGKHPLVMQTTEEEEEATEFNLINFDPTFGLKDTYPGLAYIITFEGPFKLMRGFIDGSRVAEHSSVMACETLVND